MSTYQLSSDVQVVEDMDSVTYVLPQRSLGKIRYLGLIPMGFGIVVLSALVFAFNIRSFFLSNTEEGLDWFAIVFTVVLFGVFFSALFPVIRFGAFIAFGYSKVKIQGDKLISSERALGIFRRSRKASISDIREIKVVRGRFTGSGSDSSDEDQDDDNKPIDGFTAFAYRRAVAMAEDDNGRAVLRFAVAYPFDLVKELASDVAKRCDEVAINIDGRSGGIQVVESTKTLGDHGEADSDAPDEHVESDGWDEHTSNESVTSKDSGPIQPLESPVLVDYMGGGAIFTVPPLGFTGVAASMTFFATIWLLFSGVIGALMVADGELFPLLFISIFLLIGVLMLLYGLNLAKRQAVIDCQDGYMIVTRQTLFKREQRDFEYSNIKSIRMEATGTTVNDKRVMHLVVKLNEGKKFSMLAGRDNDELRWLAHEIMQVVREG